MLYGDGWTFTITASTPTAPAAPTKASATKNSITLTAVEGCEYSKDGTNWQNGTEFTGLLPSTEYTFYQRVKATANTNASSASSASFSTELDTYAMTITLTIAPPPPPAPPAPATYTITWRNDDGTTLGTTTVTAGTVPSYSGTPEKVEDEQYTYTFSGWTPAPTAASANATYTATYTSTPKTYTITFDADGGAPAPAPLTVAYGETVTAPANPAKEGYTFGGWDPALPETMPAENLTVKAKWTADTYTITFCRCSRT